MSTASPDEAAEVEASSGSSSNFVTSALPVADGPLLIPNEETNSETFEKVQARLDAAFDALDRTKSNNGCSGRTTSKNVRFNSGSIP